MAGARLRRAVVFCVLVALVPTTVAAQAAFHGVGDLPGGPDISTVMDATKADGVIYAVGASGANNQLLCTSPNVPAGCVSQFNADTPALWTYDGITGTLVALPTLVTTSSPGVSNLSAWAISRDGAYIASTARSSVTNPALTAAVRVAREGLTNLNLTMPPFTLLPPSTVASSISADGSVLYGLTGNPGFRVYRFDVSTSTTTLIPLPPGTHTAAAPTIRGTSSDGSVLVGLSFPVVPTGTNTRAFRYVHGVPVGSISLIPLLEGGSWNSPIAVSADGNVTVVAGDSPDYPNGELYLHDATTGNVTPLGSPNTPWAPQVWGSITADGAVVAATFFGDTGRGRHAYFRNARGWFHLTSALAAQGIDIFSDGWEIEGMGVAGLSPDGTLVFGSGLHNGNREGFVAEFPAGYLASFDLPAVPPTPTTIVSGWKFPGGPGGLVFMADGTYYMLDAGHGSAPSGEYTSGFERGRYTWDGSTGTFATVQDTNGDVGLSGGNGIPNIPLGHTGDTLFLGPSPSATRVVGAPGSVVGTWLAGNAQIADGSAVLMLLADSTFLFAIDGVHHDGIETGPYSVANGVLSLTSTVDTSGEGGLTGGVGESGTFAVRLSPDELVLTLLPGDEQAIPFRRVIDPEAVLPAITSALSATAVDGLPFSYTITAMRAVSFDAIGLPPGVSVDATTGVISGTPTVAATFPVTISATNSFGATTSATLNLVVAPAKIRLEARTTFTRDPSGRIVATIVLTNTGNSPAVDAAITDIELNKAPSIPGPMTLPRIEPGASVTVVQTFDATAGASGAGRNTFRLQVKWTRGTLSINEKVTLP